MKVEATITVTTEDVSTLEQLTEGIVRANDTAVSPRDAEMAAKLYGSTTAVRYPMKSALEHAQEDRDFWKTQAEKFAKRIKALERGRRAKGKRKR